MYVICNTYFHGSNGYANAPQCYATRTCNFFCTSPYISSYNLNSVFLVINLVPTNLPHITLCIKSISVIFLALIIKMMAMKVFSYTEISMSTFYVLSLSLYEPNTLLATLYFPISCNTNFHIHTE